jgi:hypothetical protein
VIVKIILNVSGSGVFSSSVTANGDLTLGSGTGFSVVGGDVGGDSGNKEVGYIVITLNLMYGNKLNRAYSFRWQTV